MLRFFKKHKILAILLIIVLLWGIVFMCEYRRSSWYSEEQHIKRLNKRVENRYKNWNYLNGEHYESFKIYPLYEKDDTLRYFLVEFEPFGFTCIYINKYELNRQFLLFFRKSMYTEGSLYYDEYLCSPYIHTSSSGDDPILDDNGKKIEFVKSPYYLSGNIDEKKYFIECAPGDFICAIKQGDEFINVIDGKRFNLSDSNSFDEQVKIFMGFFGYRGFDLW